MFFSVLGHHGGLRYWNPNNENPIKLEEKTSTIQKQAENILRTAEESTQNWKKTLYEYRWVVNFLETTSDNPEKVLNEIGDTLWDLNDEVEDASAYENVKRFLITKMLYSLLVSADTLSAALRTDKIDSILAMDPPNPEIIDRFVGILPRRRRIDQIRSKIFENARRTKIASEINILELPTGAGKTFTGMRLATTAGKPVIYTLPYTSIIDQTVNILRKDELYDGDVLSYHHLNKYGDLENEQSEKYEYYQQKTLEMATENWFYPLVVTTYEQVMYALVWNQKRFSQRMHSIGRHALILDEIQSVPARIWDATWYVLRSVSELFETPILIMSATVPKIPDHAKIVVKYLPIQVPERSEQVFVRRTFRYAPEIDDVEKVAETVVELAKNHDRVLCVVNTRCDAYEIYEKVKKEINKDVILLSAHIPPKERLKRIKRIKEHLQKWVVISTQVVEAGVDIDADVLVRDIAPLDSIVQSAGRCNRNGERKKGEVIITEIRGDDGRLRAYTIYNQAIVNTTREILENMPENADDKWIENQTGRFYELMLEKTRKEEDMGHESIPTLMGKMWFDKVRETFALIQEIPTYTIILADGSTEHLLHELVAKKEQLRNAEKYNDRIRLTKEIQALRAKIEQYAVAIYKPRGDSGKAGQKLQYLKEKVGEALETGPFEDSFVVHIESLEEDLREKTEEVGISWICEARDDPQEERFV